MHAPKGADPFILRTGVGDHTTSLATVSAILAAVYEREKTGVGTREVLAEIGYAAAEIEAMLASGSAA